MSCVACFLVESPEDPHDAASPLSSAAENSELEGRSPADNMSHFAQDHLVVQLLGE